MKTTKDYVAFWKGKDFLSNFHSVDFKHQEIAFKNSEQAIMYRKALLFKDYKTAEDIKKESNPDKAKKLGRLVSGFSEEIWNDHYKDIYKEVLLDKFNTESMKKLLLETEDRLLIEASPFDKRYGVGLREDDPNVGNKNYWRGDNILGFILMDVRSELKNKGEV